MRIPRSRLVFNLLIKVRWDQKSGLNLNKVSPVLNQLGIEDAPYLDDSIAHYFKNLNWRFVRIGGLEFFAKVTLVI